MKQNLIYMGIGAAIVFAFEAMIGIAGLLIYKFGGFNSESLVSSGSSLNSFYSLDGDTISDNFGSGNGFGDFKIQKRIERDNQNLGMFKLYFTQTKTDESYFELNKNIIDFMIAKEYFKDNQQAQDFLVAYLGMNNYKFEINKFIPYMASIDLYDFNIAGLKKYYQAQIIKLGSFINNVDKDQFSDRYSKLSSNYTDFIKEYKGKSLSTCYYYYCSQYPEVYNYVKNAIINDKQLYSTVSSLEQKYGVDRKFFYGIIMIENLRMHTTFKGNFKQFLIGLKTPILPVMNQFSYGLYGTKITTVTKILNEYSNKDSVFYIGENDLLNKIKNEYYVTGANNMYFIANGKEQQLIDYIVNNKDIQSEIIAIYLKGQIEAWKKIGIDLNSKPGILYTLYNIGSFKQPHLNPDYGGAPINMEKKVYSFGELGQRFYYSLELDNMLNQLQLQAK